MASFELKEKMAAATDDKMAATDDVTYDVVIVGAGLAGLSTAHSLLKTDPSLKVLLLEARDRVGGRTVSLPLKVAGGGTENFDLGAQWVGLSQHHVLDTIKELNMDIYAQRYEGKKISQIGEYRRRKFSSGAATPGPLLARLEYKLFMWKVDRLSEKVPMEDPYSSPLAYELEAHTVASYAAQNLWTQAARDAVEQSVKAVYGTDASRLGMLFFLAYTNASGGSGQLYGIQGSAQEFRVKCGAQQISKNLAKVVGHDKILLSHAVTGIDQLSQAGVILVRYRESPPCDETSGAVPIGVVTSEAPSKVVRAHRVVVTAPPNLMRTLSWSPPLHRLKQFLCDNLQMGHLYKFIVTYDRAYWQEKGLSGEIYSTGGRKVTSECTTGPMCEAYDTTTNDGSPAIVGFFTGRYAIEWTQKPKAERAAAVVNNLAQFLGIEEMKQYIDYEDKMWGTDPWTGGCPVTYGTPGTLFSMPYIRSPHHGVHFAGTETATIWMGYMSGAIQSGQRAAIEVLAHLRPGLLTEKQRCEATRTSKLREPFLAQPPSAVTWGRLTLALAGASIAVAATYWGSVGRPIDLLQRLCSHAQK